jgi:hypothetical protein
MLMALQLQVQVEELQMNMDGHEDAKANGAIARDRVVMEHVGRQLRAS